MTLCWPRTEKLYLGNTSPCCIGPAAARRWRPSSRPHCTAPADSCPPCRESPYSCSTAALQHCRALSTCRWTRCGSTPGRGRGRAAPRPPPAWAGCPQTPRGCPPPWPGRGAVRVGWRSQPTWSMRPGTCSSMGARCEISKLLFLSHSECSPIW